MRTILDGPMGTELAARGVPTPAPLWSAWALDHAPEVIAQIHRDYAAAGATVHTATTFRTKRRQAGDRWEALARRAVAIARAAVPAGHRVAGSVAPLEDCYRPDLSPAEDIGALQAARAEHEELARVLVDAGADLLICETFPHVGEALAAVEACVSTGVETWAAFTAGPGAPLLSVEAMEAGAREAVRRGAAAVMVNCTAATRTLAYVERLVRIGVPVGAYANAGDAEEEIGWDEAPPEGAARYAQLAAEWARAGATILGGCCGTGPAHIRAIAAL
uniref:Homocysteine S-methyltransferase family protein n=1 Tax=Phaselicystis flava TaxID=525924 RepID=A0A3S7V0D0_9BACT|nr:homocysteine S-methyltransferase family protein [Phaselicystis flava]